MLYVVAAIILIYLGIGVRNGIKIRSQNAEINKRNKQLSTRYQISPEEVECLITILGMETSAPLQEEDDYISLVPTEYTEKCIAVLNFFLFDSDQLLEEHGAKEIAESYGLSYENRITINWLNDYMHEMATICNSMDLQDKSTIVHMYGLLTSSMIFTKYRLSFVEITVLRELFGIETDPDLMLLYEDDHDNNTMYEFMTFTSTEFTEKAIVFINHQLFTLGLKEHQKAIEKAEELGLSKDNPLTVEWLLEHPREFLEVKNGMENYGSIFFYLYKFKEAYKKVSVPEEK